MVVAVVAGVAVAHLAITTIPTMANSLTVTALLKPLPPQPKLLLQALAELPIHMLPVSSPTITPVLIQFANLYLDGGYQAYLALWYQALASQQAQGQGDATKPPGTA